jgi:hypothetical protein
MGEFLKQYIKAIKNGIISKISIAVGNEYLRFMNIIKQMYTSAIKPISCKLARILIYEKYTESKKKDNIISDKT